jgi:Zn-dependent protease
LLKGTIAILTVLIITHLNPDFRKITFQSNDSEIRRGKGFIMGHRSLSLGRIIGIPVELDYSWFLIFALLTWSFAVSYYPAEFSDWPTLVYWFTGAATAVMLFVSVLIHELGHSVVALRYGIPIRNITLFIFGGVAQIESEPPKASAEFWIAIAGPITSVLLALFFYLFQPLFGQSTPMFGLVKYLASINLLLALFNLIPGFPLDGGRVFRAFVWWISRSLKKATLVAANLGRFIAFLFIFVGFWQMFSGNFGNGLWIAFIGWFLESASSGQLRQQMIHESLAGHKVADAMSRNFTIIPPEVTLQQLVDNHILLSGRRVFIVKSDEKTVGLLTLHQLKGVPKTEWPYAQVGQIMIPASELKTVRPDIELWECFSMMNRDGVNQLPVIEDGHILGMLNREDIINFFHTLQEFGHQTA